MTEYLGFTKTNSLESILRQLGVDYENLTAEQKREKIVAQLHHIHHVLANRISFN
jgi:hypothetical protein